MQPMKIILLTQKQWSISFSVEPLVVIVVLSVELFVPFGEFSQALSQRG